MKTNILRATALLAVFVAASIYQHAGLAAAFLFVFIVAAVIAGPRAYLRGQLGAAPDTNDIASELQISVFLSTALESFKRAVLPLAMFSTVFRNLQLQGNNKVEIPYYPLQGIASKDFSSSYDFSTGAGSKTDVRELTINKRKYQPLAFTSSELARQPRLSVEDMGRLKGEKLGYDIVQDILGDVTAANFGPAAKTELSSAFDSDDVVDLRTAANKNYTGPLTVTDGVTTNTSTTVTSATARFTPSDIGTTISGTNIPASTTIASYTSATSVTLSAAATGSGSGITFTLGRVLVPWPQSGRSLIVNPDYDGALLKDSNFRRDLTVAGQGTATTGMFPNVYGFNYAQSAAIPDNGENLVGMIAFKSALLVGFSPIQPADGGRIVRYQIVTDPDTDISLEYREWFDGTSDKLMKVIEANYGHTPGEKLALKRIVSA
jgi:hypothetical protein